MTKEKLFENLKLEFPNIKQFGVTFMSGGDAFEAFMNVEFDGEDATEENQNKFIKHIEGYVWDEIFNSKHPIDVYDMGSGGNLQFYPEENKIEYQIVYYNNPDDEDDDLYEEECSQTF